MVRRLLPSVAFAHGAAALFDGLKPYVTVTHVQEDVLLGGINIHAVDGVIALAATTDPGFSACQRAGAILTYCAANVPPTATAAAVDCACCYSSTYPMVIQYSSCGSYIINSVPEATADLASMLPSPINHVRASKRRD